MLDRSLEAVRRKVVGALRRDPQTAAPPPGRSALDRWITSRLAPEEAALLFRLEELYGEGALVQWIAEALVEAGLVRRVGPVH